MKEKTLIKPGVKLLTTVIRTKKSHIVLNLLKERVSVIAIRHTISLKQRL